MNINLLMINDNYSKNNNHFQKKLGDKKNRSTIVINTKKIKDSRSNKNNEKNKNNKNI